MITLTKDIALSREYVGRIEADARRMTRLAYLRKDEGRLFPVGDMDCGQRHTWEALNEQFWGKPVGVVSFDSDPVGIYHGIGPGWMGPDLQVTNFGSVGCSSHVDPRNIAFIMELPRRPYGWIVEMMYSEEEEDW